MILAELLRRRVALLPILAGFIMLLPHWPGLIDLPGHVARYHVELDLQDSRLLQHYYHFQWHLIPNLGVDLLVYPLARLFGLDLAVRICVALIPTLTVAGMLALARVTYRRIPPTCLVALPCAFSYPFTFGFVNYCFAAALALVAAAIWLKFTVAGRSGSRMLFGIAVSPILLIAHLTGWGLFGLMAFGMVLAAERTSGMRAAAIKAVLACLPLAWPLPVIMVLGGGGQVGATHGWPDFLNIARSLIGVLREQSAPIDIVSALVLVAVALCPLLARRHLRYEPLLLVPALLVWCAVCALPSMLLGSAFANVRLIPAALALTILSVRPVSELPVGAVIAGWAFYVFRLGVTAVALLQFDATAQRQLMALDHVEAGSRVLAFKVHGCPRTWAPPRSQNLNLLATVRRDAFTNGHFTESGAQLMTIDYPAAGDLVHYGTNSVMAEPCPRWNRPTLPQALAAAPLNAFDYVWLIDAPAQLLPHDPRLTLIWQDRGSILYRIVREAKPFIGGARHQGSSGDTGDTGEANDV